MAASSPATSVPSEAAISDAFASRKSPARIARRLPQRAFTLATLRRVSASSITSSWYSEPTCTSSTATPPRITSCDTVPPVGRARDRERAACALAPGHDQVAGHLGHAALSLVTAARSSASTLGVASHAREAEQRGLRHAREARRPRSRPETWSEMGRGAAVLARSPPDADGVCVGTLAPRIPPTLGGRSLVRTVHRPGSPSGRPGARGSAPPQPQLHRHRAHPARPHPRGRGRRGEGARVARHLPRGRAQPGRGDHRSGRLVAVSGHIPFTPRAKKVLELSLREALQLGHNYIGTEHILLGLIREGEGVAAQVLVKLGADLSRVRQQVIQLLSGYQGPGGQAARRPAQAGGPARPASSPAARSCSTSSVATSPSSRARRSSTRSSAARARSSA